MDREIMINEITATREEMGLEPVNGLTKYSTGRIEKLHIKTMEEYRAWTTSRMASVPEEKPSYPGCDPDKRCVHGNPWGGPCQVCNGCNESKEEILESLPEDPKTGTVPGYLTMEYLIFLDQLREEGSVNMFGAAPELAREFGITKSLSHSVLGYWMRTFGIRHPKPTTPEKEKEMAKADKKTKTKAEKKTDKKKEVAFAVTPRVAFKALAETVWEAEDRPDIEAMSDDAVAEELKEAVSLLAPEDEETVLAMEHGKEIWETFCAMRKDLAEEAVAVVPATKAGKKEPKPPKEKKTKEPKPPAEPRYTRGEALADAIKQKPATIEALITASNAAYVAHGGKDNIKEAQTVHRIAFPVLVKLGIVSVDNGNLVSP